MPFRIKGGCCFLSGGLASLPGGGSEARGGRRQRRKWIPAQGRNDGGHARVRPSTTRARRGRRKKETARPLDSVRFRERGAVPFSVLPDAPECRIRRGRGCPSFPFPARGLKLTARSGTVCFITREATNGQPRFLFLLSPVRTAPAPGPRGPRSRRRRRTLSPTTSYRASRRTRPRSSRGSSRHRHPCPWSRTW